MLMVCGNGDTECRRLAELFKVLGDPTRIRVLAVLARGERTVGDITAELGMRQPAISHQLRQLRDARLVKARRDGQQVWYSLDDDHVVKLMGQGLEHVRHG